MYPLPDPQDRVVHTECELYASARIIIGEANYHMYAHVYAYERSEYMRIHNAHTNTCTAS